MKWSVYRDGARWSVSAPDLLAALAKAQWSWSPLSHEHYLGEGVGFEEACAPPTTLASPALYTLSTSRGNIDRAHYVGLESDTTAAVVETAASEDVRTADVLECLVREVAQARAAAEVKKKHVRTYVSGKRSGMPKFTRADNTAKREQVKADHAFNLARLARIESTRAVAHEIFGVLPLLDATGVDTDKVRELASSVVYPDDSRELHMWLLAEDARAETVRKEAEQVAVNGFAVGERCTISPSGFDDDPICGPAEVLSVCLDGDRLVFSPEWGEVYVSTARLEALGAPS